MFYIRADGNAKTGAGHIMRCLTIAEEIKKKNAVTFLCADEASASLVKKNGFPCRVLGATPFSDEELSLIAAIIEESREEGREGGRQTCENRLLIDSYLATPAYVGAISQYIRTAYMDDMCREVFPAEVIVNYNAFAKSEDYLSLYEQAKKLPQFYLGSEFIPIRSQFTDRHFTAKETVQSLLITTGGGDAENLAGSITELLLQDERTKKLHFHVVSGAFNPHMAELKKLEACHDNVTIHKNVTDMAALMCDCDIAVTAGGTTVYELCALGVPFVCFSYADNQDALVSFIGESGAALSAGSMSGKTAASGARSMSGRETAPGAGSMMGSEAAPDTVCGACDTREPVLDRIREQVSRLTESVNLRKECFESERRLIDGQGAARLAKRLLSY